MKELKKFFRKAIVFCLVVCMFAGMAPAVFADKVSEAESAYYYELDILNQLQAQGADSALIAIQQAKVDEAYKKYTDAKKEAEQYAAWQAEQAALNVQQLPEQSNEQPENLIPEQASEQPENLIPEQGSEQPENLIPEQASEQPENLIPELGNEQPEILVPEQASEQPENLIPEQGNEQPENLIPEQASEQPENLIPEQGSEQSENLVPEQGSEQPEDQLPEQVPENVGEADSLEAESETPEPEVNTDLSSQTMISQVFSGLVNLWKRGEAYFESLAAALVGANSGDVIELTDDVENGDVLEINTDTENITIDFGGHSYNVSDVAAGDAATCFSGNGSVTVSNGALSSYDADAGAVVESTMKHLTFKDMLIEGAKSIGTVLGIYGGETDLVGRTTVDAGSASELAIHVADEAGNVDLRVNTTGVINGGIQVTNIDQTATPEYTANAWLHNGQFTGDIDYDGQIAMNSKIMVDGGEYYDDVYAYVPYQTNYADVSNVYGTVHSAGANVPWTTLKSKWTAPTFVNIRKSGGAVSLPWGVLAKNSSDKYIAVNGSLLERGGVRLVNGWYDSCCAKHEIVDGAESEWYKGTEDGFSLELDSDISYVTVDGKKVDAEIDGVEVEFDAEYLEDLSVGKHIIRVVLKDGCSLNTTVKIHKDEKIEWVKGSKNGLMFEFEKDIKKVLVNNVKVASEIEENNIQIDADVFEDLKLGRQTIEFVLEDMSHIIMSVTITK